MKVGSEIKNNPMSFRILKNSLIYKQCRGEEHQVQAQRTSDEAQNQSQITFTTENSKVMLH